MQTYLVVNDDRLEEVRTESAWQILLLFKSSSAPSLDAMLRFGA